MTRDMIVQQLAEAYCRWEITGRGWQRWDAPVGLEPRYAPFQPAIIPSRAFDDGRVPTLGSRLVGFLQRLVGGVTEPMPAQSADEPDAAECGDREPDHRQMYEPVEWGVVHPRDAPESHHATERLLLCLSNACAPVAVEYLGTTQGVCLQWVTDRSDAELFAGQWRAHLPGIGLIRQEDSLVRAWTGGTGPTALVVEFGLSRSFLRSVAAQTSNAADILAGVIAAVGGVRAGEAVVLQVMTAVARAPWASAILQASSVAAELGMLGESVATSAQVRDKLGRPLCATLLRVGARAEGLSRVHELVRRVTSALSVLGGPTGNELIPLTNDDDDHELHVADLMRRQTRRSGMLLTSDEVALLMQPPSSAVTSPLLVRDTRPSRRAPDSVTGGGVELGVNRHQGIATPVRLSVSNRVRHIHVVGASGTGKSNLLLSMLVADIAAGEGVALLDPHGDLLDQVLSRIPQSRWDDVVLFDPADETHTVGFNVLGAHSELEKTLLASDLVGIFRRLSTTWGDQMSSVLGNAVLAFLESSRGGTLADLRQFLIEPPFRTEFLKSVADPEVVYYWQKQFPLLVGRPQAPLLTRLDTLLRPKPIRRMVSQRDACLDLGRVVNDGKILLARLSIGAIGEENASLLGGLLMSKLHQVAISRQEVSESRRRPFWVYADEFHHFVTPSVGSLLSGVRKYRMGLVLAHQEFRELETRDRDVAGAVFANSGTRVCFRVGDDDARTLAGGFSHFASVDLQNLRVGDAICRVDGADNDFNLSVTLVPPLADDHADAARRAIIERSRSRYARPVETAARVPSVQAFVPAGDPVPFDTPARAVVAGRSNILPASPDPNIERTPLPATTVRKPKAIASPGRGGPEHKYLQEFIKCFGENLGYRGTIEHSLADGGFVDVLLTRDGVSIACEISITTPTAAELNNIRKCISATFTHVVLVCPNAEKRERVRRQVTRVCGEEIASAVKVVGSEDFCSFLHGLEDGSRAQVNPVIRGYAVKTTLQRLDAAQQQAVEQRVAKVVAGSIRRVSAKASPK